MTDPYLCVSVRYTYNLDNCGRILSIEGAPTGVKATRVRNHAGSFVRSAAILGYGEGRTTPRAKAIKLEQYLHVRHRKRERERRALRRERDRESGREEEIRRRRRTVSQSVQRVQTVRSSGQYVK